MAWTLTEPVANITVTLVPDAGDIQVEAAQSTVVLYSLRGASPYVSDSPARAATITVPELVFTDATQFQLLQQLRGLGRRVVLTDDTGTAWPVRFTGSLTWRVRDTPDRATAPKTYAKITLVGVA